MSLFTLQTVQKFGESAEDALIDYSSSFFLKINELEIFSEIN